MILRTSNDRSRDLDLGPSHATLKGIRGSLVIGGPEPVDPQRRENLAAAQRAYRERKREQA